MNNKTAKIISEIIQEFAKPITYDAIQRKTFGDMAEGYNMGYLIEKLNNTLAKYGWDWYTELLPIGLDGAIYLKEKETFGQNKSKTTITVRLRLCIKNEEGQVVMSRESFGGCQLINNSLGDSLKGAQTDALKKALSYLNLGNDAFKGKIEQQIKEFEYMRNNTINRCNTYLSTYLDKEVKGTTLAFRFMTKILQKVITDAKDLLHEDLVRINEAIDKLEEEKNKESEGEKATENKKAPKPKASKKGKVKNDNTDEVRKDTPKNAEKQMDNPIDSNDEIPF